MKEFWEESFKSKKEMWGNEPSNSAIIANDLFMKNGIKRILIPGFGYGRNANLFHKNGMDVTGIEISQTAINIANKKYGNKFTLYKGTVNDMPLDNNLYEGIFCHGLIYLLNQEEREKFILACYNQLTNDGFMLFSVITKEAKTFGQGTFLSKDRFEMFGGVKIFFYDYETIKKEFSKVGLFEIMGVRENYPFYLIKCKKTSISN